MRRNLPLLPSATSALLFALAIRPARGGAWVQAGVVLCAHPNPPIFVDAQARAGGDGGSPGHAFATLRDALAAAAMRNAANVWVRNGSYAAAGCAVPADV